MGTYCHEGAEGREPTYKCIAIVVAHEECRTFFNELSLFEFALGICFHLKEPLDSIVCVPSGSFTSSHVFP